MHGLPAEPVRSGHHTVHRGRYRTRPAENNPVSPPAPSQQKSVAGQSIPGRYPPMRSAPHPHHAAPVLSQYMPPAADQYPRRVTVRGCKCQPVILLTDSHHTDSALLNNIALIIKLLCFAPDITGTQGRVSGKRQFTVRRKNADTVIGLRILRFQQKVVSLRFVQRAKRCISSSVISSASTTTASALPSSGTSEKHRPVKLISAGIQRYYPFYVLTEQS